MSQRPKKFRAPQSSQSGMALASALLLIGMMFAAVTTLTVLLQHDQDQVRVERQREKAQRLANRLQGLMSNFAVLRHSLAVDAPVLPGNLLMRACVSTEPVLGPMGEVIACERFFADAGGYPSRLGGARYPDSHEMNLVPPPGYAFGLSPSLDPRHPDNPQQRGVIKLPATLLEVMNCAAGEAASSEAEPLCLLAGVQDDQRVGYSIDGDTGAQANDCFPLVPKVYINPYCGRVDDDCRGPPGLVRVEAFELSLVLEHRSQGRRGSTCAEYPPFSVAVPLSVRPKTLDWEAMGERVASASVSIDYGNPPSDWVRIPLTSLLGGRCNDGARVTGYRDGVAQCTCQYPFRPQGRNARGPICMPPQVTCPAGTINQGFTPSGEPRCVAEGGQAPGKRLTFKVGVAPKEVSPPRWVEHADATLVAYAGRDVEREQIPVTAPQDNSDPGAFTCSGDGQADGGKDSWVEAITADCRGVVDLAAIWSARRGISNFLYVMEPQQVRWQGKEYAVDELRRRAYYPDLGICQLMNFGTRFCFGLGGQSPFKYLGNSSTNAQDARKCADALNGNDPDPAAREACDSPLLPETDSPAVFDVRCGDASFDLKTEIYSFVVLFSFFFTTVFLVFLKIALSLSGIPFLSLIQGLIISLGFALTIALTLSLGSIKRIYEVRCLDTPSTAWNSVHFECQIAAQCRERCGPAGCPGGAPP